MPEPKAQLVDPQGPIDVPGLSITGVTTATGGFVGAVQGTATGFNTTAVNLNVGIVTATKFQGNTTGNVSGLADDTNINVGIITSTSFTGDLVGNAAGLSTTTSNIKAGILSATSFAGNFTGVASGITGTPNIVVGIMTGTLKGDGSTLTGIAATNWIANNVTANSSTTAIDLALGNVVKFTQSANTTVSFANTGTSNIVTFIRTKDATSTERTLTWPSSINWDGGSAPTFSDNNLTDTDYDVVNLLTRDEGVTWYGWQTVKYDDAFSYGTGKQVWAWGYNNKGALGQNEGDHDGYSSPVQIPGNDYYSAMSGQFSNTISFIKTTGYAWSIGRNYAGALGLNQAPGTVDNISSPVQVPGTAQWKQFKISGYGGIGIQVDGSLWTWGANSQGALGLNQSGPSKLSSPTQVGSGTDWAYCARGYEGTAAAIKTDGTLWSWGYNGFGQMGNNTQGVRSSSPVQVPGTTWSTVAKTHSGTAATKTDGTVWMWGNNAEGSLGQNNRTLYSSPVQLGSGTDWSKISIASYESAVMGLKTDGTLWSWGYNAQGQMGNGNTTRYSSPVQIPGTTWNDIRSGYRVNTATRSDGTLWAWGNNEKGQLGQNNLTDYSSPKQIPGTSWSFAPDNTGMNGYLGTFVVMKTP